MASIRRTLSPYHDRTYQNGEDPYSPKLFPSSKYSSPLQDFAARFRRFLGYPPRKGQHGWRRAFYRCLFFFFLGFLLGLVPFGHVDGDDIRAQSHDFFEIKPPLLNVHQKDLVLAHQREASDDRVLVGEVSLGERVRSDLVPRKQLIVVTPTYDRALQAYFLNRLGQVLRLVPPPLLWIVVETKAASMETAEILRKTGVMYRHLVCAHNSTNVKDRGVHQRNTALDHIERHRLDGIVYFADDDNIYSLDLFHSLREISRFGTWPVAMVEQSKNKAILEGPVCNGSQIVGWHTNEKSKRLRRFHVDMSGFAFNSTILWDPKRWRRPTPVPIRQLDTVKEGFQETTFIQQVVEDESQMEGIPPSCSRIINWHLHMEARHIAYPRHWLLQKNLDVVLPIN
ncbi:hypothetical protein I3843_15G129900 [Carya illinoinensis]|uniref:Glycosyltransferases n=1 Tax=Carya illinoinensis TaxID=32201 RepID=A0A8T1NBP5_CARIL|nr:probable beta-1,4-xylosyltransferase IRX9H [Carya illinoinensis]KAG2667859.1 hypothetical protein I3760_15G134000 [Carya illinoinensis]KAG6627765.1 hypothetical protein CIPAW_15G151800 [Carya illinoinensis]KAG6676105.1 hypothetical protein I3842_15G136400 [Carya illinoinensis]KAG7944972.1 hypothetical protein I3843_15G129900 [Carya illinoinensis]